MNVSIMPCEYQGHAGFYILCIYSLLLNPEGSCANCVATRIRSGSRITEAIGFPCCRRANQTSISFTDIWGNADFVVLPASAQTITLFFILLADG